MKAGQRNMFIVAGFYLLAVIVGGTLVGYAFSGLITFISFIVMLEAVPFLRFMAYKLNALVEVILFLFALYAKFHFGVTIAMSLMIAGILYSMLYRNYIKDIYMNPISKK